jgi:hypothetical protein
MSNLPDGWQKFQSLDEVALKIASMPKETRDALTEQAHRFTAGMKWLPSTGSQTDAYFSKADITLFGGSGGAGKSDLGLGLAMTAHRKSLIMRQQYNDLDALTERIIKINGSRFGYNGSNPPSLKTSDGRFIQFSGAKTEQWQGAAFDLKFFDEAVTIPEEVIRFHLGWIRSTDEGQRTRAVLATNPPVNSLGDWIIPMFSPWLDITHPNPAQPGELRWYVKDPDGKDFEVPDNRPYQFPGEDRPNIPMSRTFIPGKLSGNPYLASTDYQAKLDALDEPLRSAVRDGNFMAHRKDQEDQVIPTAWVIAAQKRWRKDGGRGLAMTAIGLDVGAGGADRVVLSMRYGSWFAPLITTAGKDAPDGSSQMALVARHRRDNCAVVVDVGGGYGGDVCSIMRGNGIIATRFNGSEGSVSRTKDGSGRIFENRRAEAYWRLREALNPDQAGGSIIELPDDAELRSELTATTYIPDILRVQLEDKKKIKARLGRSPDKADAVVMAFAPGDSAAKRQRFSGGGAGGERPTHSNVGYSSLKKFG